MVLECHTKESYHDSNRNSPKFLYVYTLILFKISDGISHLPEKTMTMVVRRIDLDV
jgi:hypothetical protein